MKMKARKGGSWAAKVYSTAASNFEAAAEKTQSMLPLAGLAPLVVAKSVDNGLYPVDDTTSLFCFNVGVYYPKTPQMCVQAPDRCIPVLQGLEYSKVYPHNFDQQCFLGPRDIPRQLGYKEQSAPLKLFQYKDKGAQFIPASYLFNASTPGTPAINANYFGYPEDVDGESQVYVGCISHEELHDKQEQLESPNITYQMLANMLPIFSSSDANVIANIQMFTFDNVNAVDDYVSAYNTTPAGMFTKPSALTFEVEQSTPIWYQIPGASRQDNGKIIKPFKRGAFKGTVVVDDTINGMGSCKSVVNVPVTKVYRKMGVLDKARDQFVPSSGYWFNTTECQLFLNDCDDITLQKRPCKTIDQCPPMHKLTPCTLFSDATCLPVRTAPPTTPPRQLSSADKEIKPTETLFVVFIVVAVAIVVVYGFVIKRRQNKENKEKNEEKQTLLDNQRKEAKKQDRRVHYHHHPKKYVYK